MCVEMGKQPMRQKWHFGSSAFRLDHVEKAIDASAVEILLVTDELFRYVMNSSCLISS